MGKLHELLAVEGNLENQANKVRSDLMTTFEKKRHLFEEKRVVFTPSVEGEKTETSVQSDLQSTVTKELTWISSHLIKALDASYQVAEANTHARADVILDDDAQTVLLKDVPATALLELEKRASEILALIQAIPTLDPAKGFRTDLQRENTFMARDVVKTKTKKTVEVIVKYQATKEHPAQTEMINVDKPIGEIREQEWSGLITPAAKAELIERAEMISRSIRKARARANEAEVDPSKKLGKKIIQFVFDGVR